jgi:hypothetical protein
MFVFSNFASASNQDKTFVVPPSSTPQYSPPADENWPPVIVNEDTGSFENAEDSILTSFRRENPNKYNALKRKMRQPFMENISEQFNVLRNLNKQMAEDMQQSCIIINYIEDILKSSNEPARKSVKFPSL